MSPEAYLLFSIKHECYMKRSWVISVFAVTQDNEETKKITYPGKLIREPFGFFFIDDSGERVQIETTKKTSEPLFSVKDQITITRDWIPTLSTAIRSIRSISIVTSIGTLFINLVALYKPFNGKFPYMEGKFKVSDIEDQIAERLQSTPPEGQERKQDVYYIDEYINFANAIVYLETLATIFVHSVTEVGLLPAPGRKEFKKELLKRYDGKLQDPVEMAKFETELKNFDREYLKNDPSYGKFMSGKVEGARSDSFLSMGGQQNNFNDSMEVTPIVQSLDEGFPLDPEGFTAIANTIRYGSFSRGAETVNGGVVAKALMRAADSWRITKGDCGSTLGIQRIYGETEIKKIVGRYLLVGSKLVLIENIEQAKAYINRKIIVRSPQYCSREGTQTCEVCAGLALAKYPTGLPIPLMEVSGGILNDSLKKMHNSKLSTVTMKLSDVIS